VLPARWPDWPAGPTVSRGSALLGVRTGHDAILATMQEQDRRAHSCLAAEATIDPKFAFQKLAYDVLLSPPASKPPITPSR
jgi:hypothetical protein